MIQCLRKITHCITHSKISREKLNSELSKLFSFDSTKKQLYSNLKILPHYFEAQLVDNFCKSKYFDEYLEYINDINQCKTNNSYQLKKYFTDVRLIRIIDNYSMVRCLEAYLHWLTNECQSFDIHKNNYFFEILNLDRPDKWFQIKNFVQQRVFIYHHGPTNSGKSTSAVQQLKNLKEHQTGIYMAPLRLLAWEYQQKLGNCSLVTGQEKQFKNSNLISCTIEAAPLMDQYDVAVIDEIQMIGDIERGWAWTKAILAIKAKRIHLCGDQRAIQIVSKLLELTGDVLQQRRYSRLSKLTLIHKTFKLDGISPGDCFINFSMNSLIKHRNDINKMINQKQKQGKTYKQKITEPIETSEQGKNLSKIENKKEKMNHTAIVYGRLPSQCRKSQAKSFNSMELPYLVATNAIGMGLNLNIKKIVFMAIERSSGLGTEQLQEHQIQQIAGRAGRGTETGYVQCATPYILRKVKKALSNVNQTYGIQLENISDIENEHANIIEDDKAQEQKKQTVSNIKYSPLLKRNLKQKECRIIKACFYFQADFIIMIKMYLEQMFKKEISIVDLLKYLHNYAKLGDLYVLQESKNMDYLLKLLESSKYDLEELFHFYHALTLSQVAQSTKKSIKSTIQFYHREYINNFIKYRKVQIPKIIVQNYQVNFEGFRYMDQIIEMQYYFSLLETYVWLWSKFQFAFCEIKKAKEIKLALAIKINEVLLNNQFLLQNTKQDSNFSSFDRIYRYKRQTKKDNKTKKEQTDSTKEKIIVKTGLKIKKSQTKETVKKKQTITQINLQMMQRIQKSIESNYKQSSNKFFKKNDNKTKIHQSTTGKSKKS